MIYLDYSATTPVNPEVLDSLVKVSKDYIGNPNSMHNLGVKSRALLKSATRQIADCLNVKMEEIIYTSGATEANNTALLGVALRYKNRGNHIILSKLEHPSEYVLANYLENLGFRISYVNNDSDGLIDLDDLKSLITDKTILVSIVGVNSEVGVRQPLKTIRQIIKKENPNTIFHSDLTQGLGKVAINLNDVDLASFSGHKIYGLKGIGCLVKKRGIELVPIIHGGKSQTIYRSGTPMPALYASFAKALRLVYTDFDSKYSHIVKLRDFLINELLKIDLIHVNSNENSIPQIINFSIQGIKPETMLHALSEKDIYISTKTACSEDNSLSESVLALTKNKDLAKSSLRISISYLTTEEEIEYFVKVLQEKIKELSFQKGE